ncbi:MAG TPA: NAD(P)/FAD-dependent oxidoreductase [Nevskiales bacterium]|nr:NAD(P)/FAD-dependent oxidoreductase [Nevskiales bacterium]
MSTPAPQPHHVVIVGGGFAGLFAARALGRRAGTAGFRVTLLDKRNFHLFQPLLYQVATGSLVVGDIATPQRVVLRRFRNVQTLMATAYDLDPARKMVYFEGGETSYDTLIVATGVKHHYFGKDHWRDYAPGLKTVEHALEMRRRIFSAFERAELATSAEQRQALLTFVVVGAGPTGVELAGALGELAHRTMVKDFRSIDPREAKILLVEGTPHVLPTYPEKLRAKARRQLEALGVTVITQAIVEEVGPGSVRMRIGEHSQSIAAETVLWAAGVKASAFGEVLARRTGVALDRSGKVMVQPDLSLPGYPDIFVAGDLAHVKRADGQPVPGVAQGAIQQGRYLARLLQRRARGQSMPPFRYRDLGSMAVIGRNKAVGDLRVVKVSGVFAWFTWAGVHIWALIDPEQRISVFLTWVWKYFTYKNGSRLVTGDPPNTRKLMQSNGRQ